MKIWVVKEGEPLPLENSNEKLMRSGMIASMLATRSNEVIWWSSTYLHFKKKYCYKQEKEILINENLKLHLLHSEKGYQKNISFKRLQYSKDLGVVFRKQTVKNTLPDIIFCSWPLIDLSYDCVRFGQEHNIPVVIDIRDFWPDIFIQAFPENFRQFVKIGVKTLFEKKVSYVMKNATAVIGVIPKALDFAASHGRHLNIQKDHVVFLAYDSKPVSKEDSVIASEYWHSIGVDENKFIISYIGTISNRIGDFDTIIEAAKKSYDHNILFVLCGTGNYFEELSEKTKNLDNVILPGYKNIAEIQSLLAISQIGLLAYRNTEDFIDSLPNKFGEYLSGGLIILTELKGLSRRMLEEYNCGAYYHDADSLLAQILKVKKNKSLQNEMSSNAVNLYHQKFNASVVYGEFCEFLESLGNNDT